MENFGRYNIVSINIIFANYKPTGLIVNFLPVILRVSGPQRWPYEN